MYSYFVDMLFHFHYVSNHVIEYVDWPLSALYVDIICIILEISTCYYSRSAIGLFKLSYGRN